MLLELTISDFAIIEEVHLSLSPGFNVMTGETGAGKSIIIDAVGALLGGRVGAEFVRAGASASRVEGVFSLSENDGSWPALRLILDEYGLEADPESVIISREIGANGRSLARVNGRAVPVHVLQQVGRLLVDIHGQTEHLSLLRVARHLDFLDSYGGLLDLRGQVAEKVGALRQVRRAIQDLTRDEREMARRLDLLSYQVNEIEAAGIVPGEDEQLETERRMLANAEKLTAHAEDAYRALYDGVEPQRSVLDLLDEVSANLVSLAKLDPNVAEQVRAMEEAKYQLEDVASFLRGYRDGIECDPARLDVVDERLTMLRNLKRKYGASIEEVLAFRDRAQTELRSISGSEERLADLRNQEALLLTAVAQLAESLSNARQEAAIRLSRTVEHELASLGMDRSRFEVRAERKTSADGVRLSDGQVCDFDATGIDAVEFMLSPNPGEPVKPLARIASGGEISRVMLAMKTALSRVDPVGTLIFDEIDAGIGGRTAPIIGRKLWSLSQSHQVICVTHLPQIAALGDEHLHIRKEVKGDRTGTLVDTLVDAERVDELAAMLGGSSTRVARENARELILNGQRWKEEHGHKEGAD